jgi:hypothetical protein
MDAGRSSYGHGVGILYRGAVRKSSFPATNCSILQHPSIHALAKRPRNQNRGGLVRSRTKKQQLTGVHFLVRSVVYIKSPLLRDNTHICGWALSGRDSFAVVEVEL